MNHSDESISSHADDDTTVDDWRGLGDLVSLATERLTAPVEGIHHAIADRWFGLAGRGGVPARRAYRVATGSIYTSVRLAGSALGAALGATAAGSRGGLRPLWRTPAGGSIQAVANAVWGDELERRGSGLRIELGLRDSASNRIGTEPTALARAFPQPTSRLVVLLHGLGETERCWRRQADDDDGIVGLADKLAADSFTPLLVRYNSGRHVSDNGVALASVLEEIMLSWPVAVEDISLVGHSMGGLVARSAVHVGFAAGQTWVEEARHVVTLGSPHLGAPLEKGANLFSWGLSRLPESRPLGDFLDHRSSGIKDLRFGAILEDDWQGADPDALLENVVGDNPLPNSVQQHFMAGVITEESTHPVGMLLGDLIVRVSSGTGRGRRRHVPADDVRVVGRQRHFDLLHDPAVHEQVQDWLVRKPELLHG